MANPEQKLRIKIINGQICHLNNNVTKTEVTTSRIFFEQNFKKIKFLIN